MSRTKRGRWAWALGSHWVWTPAWPLSSCGPWIYLFRDSLFYWTRIEGCEWFVEPRGVETKKRHRKCSGQSLANVDYSLPRLRQGFQYRVNRINIRNASPRRIWGPLDFSPRSEWWDFGKFPALISPFHVWAWDIKDVCHTQGLTPWECRVLHIESSFNNQMIDDQLPKNTLRWWKNPT